MLVLALLLRNKEKRTSVNSFSGCLKREIQVEGNLLSSLVDFVYVFLFNATQRQKLLATLVIQVEIKFM